jgi:hypothetical protein
MDATEESRRAVATPANALVVLSGLHPTLPESEVRACAPCRVVARWQRVLLVETPFPEALDRLAYAALVLDFLGVGTIERLPFAAAEAVRGTYSVRVTGVSTDLRQALHRLVWHALPQPRVALDKPDTELPAYAVPDGIWWGRPRVGSAIPSLPPARRSGARSSVPTVCSPGSRAAWSTCRGCGPVSGSSTHAAALAPN